MENGKEQKGRQENRYFSPSHRAFCGLYRLHNLSSATSLTGECTQQENLLFRNFKMKLKM